jgi:predicted outer membrane repeat protein
VTNVNDSTDTETKVDYITVNPPAYIGPVWHISTTGSDVWGNGSTQYPFATIQYGINVSSNTDTVLVQPDTYFENIDYNGKNITVASLFLTTQDTAYISTTIIDGNSSGSVVTFNNGEDLTVILCGFTITNGSATCGGGIYCSSSSPSLQNVTISGNSASYGGGIYCQNNSSPSLENVTITGNASDSGGGINCQNNSSPSLQNVTISGNSASDSGGGIRCFFSSPSLDNVTISGNSASIWGGGIYCSMSNPILINSILWNDSPEEIYINSGSLTATYSDIQGGFTGTDNIDSDPLFVNPGIGDYHLQSISPCIDAGDPASPLDPDCTIADMGAYYFHQQYNGPVWHISTTGSDLTGTGCEQNPFATIQHGINVASNTDTVLVHIGTYVENINYNGKNITVGSLFLTTQDTTYISSTTIDGNSIGRVVIFNSGEDSTAVLCGFTITNGSAGFGGGIFCGESNPSLKNVTISGNSASGDFGYGAGICCWENSSPSLENVTISGNSANYGGGICCWYSSPILQNVTISGNSASGTFGYGGGIYFYESSLSFENITITGNSANYGGGIYCYFSSPSLENVTITSNNVIYDGGGIYCYWYSSPSLQNVTITGNSAVDYGGGIYCYNDTSNPSLINSILWNDSPQEIYINSSSVTVTYSDIQGGFTGTGNIDADPLFADPGIGDYHLTWANFPIPDSTMSPCIDTGDPSSPFDPDGTISDMGAFYFDKSPGAPVITAVTDVPDDQGRYVQVIWNRSPYDAPNSPVTIESYSVWRYDDIFRDRGIFEIYEDPREIFEKAAKDNDKNYYWQRDDEILTFITQLPAVGYAQYSVVSPTLIDSSVVSINYSVFKVLAHTDVTLIYYPSIPDSGYSIDNIAPDETRVYIVQNGSNIGLIWDEVEYGTFQGNSYLELNGIWYKIYAGDTPDFICDEAHLLDTVTNLNYDYPLAGEDKKFFKIVVSDQPEAGRFVNRLAKPEKPAGDYRKLRR